MLTLQYNRLKLITQTEKPYRGNPDRFPIGSRKHNTKCFYRRQEGDQVVFDITYGYTYERTDLTAEEYAALLLAGADNLRKEGVWENGQQSTSKFRHYQFRNFPSVLGTVRPDNTFEFNKKDSYHQGERQLLSSWSRGYFINDSRRGGMIYRSGFRGDMQMMPIWKGMRVNCETMQPAQYYELLVKQVDRKVSKELMAPYKDFYKTTEVMLKAMDWSTFIQVAGDVHKQYKDETGQAHDHNAFVSYGSIAERVKNDAPIDAAILFMLAMNVGQLRWDTVQYTKTGSVRTSYSHESPEELFILMKRNINKYLYREHEETFKRVEHEPFKRYPTGDWGVDIMVNGEKKEQYGYGY